MRTSFTYTGLTLAAALVAGIAPVVAAPPNQSDRGQLRLAATSYQTFLTFDHHESLEAGTKVRDASNHGHFGRVLVDGGGRLRPDDGLVRRAADFPNRCRGCGRAIIEVADGRGLDPKRREFTIGAAVRVTKTQVTTGSNLVQKGYFNQDGGQFKLQLAAGGTPSCVVFGGRGRIKVDTGAKVANGRWHRLSCTRTSNAVTLRVDGTVRGVVEGATGLIANTAPVRIGGKKVSAGNKQFHGDLDSVFIRFID